MANATIKAPCVLEYLDFRQYLQDLVSYRKNVNKYFSLRSWTLQMGLSSGSFWSSVIKGKKNLSEDSRHRCALVLGLRGNEEAYFHWLVQFNQAKDMNTQNYCFGQLRRYRSSRAKTVGEGQLRFFSRWHYAAVWNYFGLKKRRADLKRIAEILNPPVSEAQVAEAISVLEELGMLRRLAGGVYEATDCHWTTEPEAYSLAVKNHALELLGIAGELLKSVPPRERQYNTLMFQVSETGFQTIKERIRQFQEELRDILDRDQNEDRIYTLTMSLFPNLKEPVR